MPKEVFSPIEKTRITFRGLGKDWVHKKSFSAEDPLHNMEYLRQEGWQLDAAGVRYVTWLDIKEVIDQLPDKTDLGLFTRSSSTQKLHDFIVYLLQKQNLPMEEKRFITQWALQNGMNFLREARWPLVAFALPMTVYYFLTRNPHIHEEFTSSPEVQTKLLCTFISTVVLGIVGHILEQSRNRQMQFLVDYVQQNVLIKDEHRKTQAPPQFLRGGMPPQ